MKKSAVQIALLSAAGVFAVGMLIAVAAWYISGGTEMELAIGEQQWYKRVPVDPIDWFGGNAIVWACFAAITFIIVWPLANYMKSIFRRSSPEPKP